MVNWFSSKMPIEIVVILIGRVVISMGRVVIFSKWCIKTGPTYEKE